MPGSFAEFPYAPGDIASRDKLGCVRIDNAGEGAAFPRHPFHIRVGIFLPLTSKLAARLLDQPKANDIFKERHRAAEAKLICQVAGVRTPFDQRLRTLRAEQRPCAAGDEDEILFFCGYGHDGACGIVRRHRDNGNVRNAEPPADIFLEGSGYRSRSHKLRQDTVRKPEGVQQGRIPGSAAQIQHLRCGCDGQFRMTLPS